MFTIDIAIATFLLAGMGFVAKLSAEMKREMKESLKEQNEIISQLKLLNYRMEQVELSCNFSAHSRG